MLWQMDRRSPEWHWVTLIAHRKNNEVMSKRKDEGWNMCARVPSTKCACAGQFLTVSICCSVSTAKSHDHWRHSFFSIYIILYIYLYSFCGVADLTGTSLKKAFGETNFILFWNLDLPRKLFCNFASKLFKNAAGAGSK